MTLEKSVERGSVVRDIGITLFGWFFLIYRILSVYQGNFHGKNSHV